VKLIVHLHLVPGSGMVELYVHSPIRLHGVVLYYMIKYRGNFTRTLSEAVKQCIVFSSFVVVDAVGVYSGMQNLFSKVLFLQNLF
jgi:hypothetical protein